MEGKAISPADVSELLLKKKRYPTAALEGLLEALAKAPSVSEKPAVKTLDFDEINMLAETVVQASTPPAAEDADSGSDSSTVQPGEQQASKHSSSAGTESKCAEPAADGSSSVSSTSEET